MPLIANTPESVLNRTDSLDPAATCRGLTSNGRPCRRSLASSPLSASAAGKQQQTDASEMYCWQHKDQAVSVSQQNPGPNPLPLKPRGSIDTLMERLGLLDINEAGTSEKRRRQRKPAQKRQTKRTICCCFEVIEEEDIQPPRPVSAPTAKPQQPSGKTSSRIPSLSPHQTPSSGTDDDPLAWIPTGLSPETLSNLTNELAKPISEKDEPGYIYMFWLTPTTSDSKGPPPSEVASSLLPPTSSPGRDRRVSDALRTARYLNALASAPTSDSPGTIRLKIGRANNVQRRLNEWSRQCSHEISLIRYYPYTPSTPQPSPSRRGAQQHDDSSSSTLVPGRKVPHVHRVEHLIHLELSDVRLRNLGKCPDCGKEHREWFEVPAEKSSLKRVDDCIRRWVKWAEMH
ncbi:DUF1766-domain-containing protein [Aspergillus sclerotioniger CBS 115572]|uniref:DUF1766-domain-containing protein n=1 Tax=Aspergillus sclerotioniger CBS 115572 TaxID=1450535 RepID=A0A317WZL1_9EURO|nr:DUF1766-domain-containing protein [Aspergillus sclerotioniger CBS 115572]PWY91421.1 DUF1766-domain-containing protein [Aspergillus sclerotioniger CBS 115572]